MSDIADEISEVREKLGIGLSVDDRIKKVLVNQYQYASAGDTKAFVAEITALRAKLQEAVEVMRPFAQEERWWLEHTNGDQKIWTSPNPNYEEEPAAEFTVGALRRAAAFLAGLETEKAPDGATEE